jgi:hypothetical protein
VIVVDVILGPLLTLSVFNRNKPPQELRRDLAVIGALQIAALAYGLWTVSVARPVHLVFEIDRFRAVHAIEIDESELLLAPPALQQLPWTGPTTLSLRAFRSSKEKSDLTLAAVSGVSLSARPTLWQSYEQAKPEILRASKPLSDLKARFPQHVPAIDAALKAGSAPHTPAQFVGYLPMTGRDKFWTVLLDLNSTEVIAFVPIDSF